MDINALKKARSMDFSKISSALQKSTEGGYKNDDEDYFKLVKDKAGNASAVIRFLPAAEGDDLPWVGVYSHAFKGPTGKWYIENCLSTIGKEDPVNAANSILWQGSDEDKKIVKDRKRKLTYFANVFVVSDPANRANEGKVLKFKFGKKIFEKIKEKLEPTFEDEKPLNVFDLWEGANFKLRMRQVEGYPNYDQSAFGEIGPIADDGEIEAILKQQKPLKGLLEAGNFKSYDELKKKFDMVISTGTAAPSRAMEDEPTAPAVIPKAEKPAKAIKAAVVEDDSTDEMEDYFKSIV